MKKNSHKYPSKNYIVFFAIVIGIAVLSLGSILLRKGSIKESVSMSVPSTSPTVTPSPAEINIVPSGEQRDCPNGFFYYENKDFSICYPNTMTVKPSYHIQNANATETDAVLISNVKRSVNILPIFFGVGGPNVCIEKSQVIVSNLPAVRELNATTTNEKCGILQEITTIISRKNGLYFYLYEDAKDKVSLNLDEYKIIESSLVIK